MRKLGYVFMTLAVCILAAPPTAFAVVCNTYTFTTPIYYADCGCTACSSWSLWNCTECVDPSTGSACWTNSSSPCEPLRDW